MCPSVLRLLPLLPIQSQPYEMLQCLGLNPSFLMHTMGVTLLRQPLNLSFDRKTSSNRSPYLVRAGLLREVGS